MSIPQRIIQTGKDRRLLPAAKAAVTNLKLLHPSWDYMYFDDADIRQFLRDKCPEHEAAFDSFSYPIQRIDFFRYLAVYHLGGFYFDLDVFLSQPIDDLCMCGCVFPFEELTASRYLRATYGIDWEIGNYAFGAAAGHPFLKTAIENCVRSQTDLNWLKPMMAGIPRFFRDEYDVLNTTGPGLLTRTFAEQPEIATDIHVLFPEDVCDPKNWHQFGSYGVHLMDGSWRARGGHLRRRLKNFWEAWMLDKAMKVSRCHGKSRKGALGRKCVEAVSP